MSDPTTLTFEINPQQFEALRKHFAMHGVDVPDEAAGEISQKGVKIAFTYDGITLRLTIIDKPWLVTEDYVAGKLSEFVRQTLA